MSDLENLCKNIGLKWDKKSRELFVLAFTHKSINSKEEEHLRHNERLEFLGDAILEFVITELLFSEFPTELEGQLNNKRASLVKGENLSKVARRLELGKYMIMSKGEKTSGGQDKDYLLENVLEAFIGAIYLNFGLKVVKKFIEENIWVDLEEILRNNFHINSKTKLQEFTQNPKISITPIYKVLEESGKDHEKSFIIGVFLKDKQIGEGSGKSKKEAELSSASVALKNKKKWIKLL